MSTKTVIWLSILAVIFILVFNFSFWLNRSIFDKEAFVNETVTVIQSQDVRNAIAGEIIDQAFADLPLIRETVGDFAQSAISGLLGSRAIKPVIRALAAGFNDLITAKEPKAVVIDTSGIVNFIKPIASAVNQRLGTQIPTDLPTSIVLVKKGQIPTIYSWGMVLLWVGPVVGLIGLGIIVGMIWVSHASKRRSVLKIIGATLALGGVIFIILVSMFQSPILASIDSENVRTIVSNIYSAFAGRLMAQTWLLVFIGVLFVVVGYTLPRFLEGISKVFHIKIEG